MADCYIARGGGGAGLNFKVKAYASELLLPATAKENTIAVITETPIAGYQISAETPENPVEGFVWILSGSASKTPISATKKNPVIIYPSGAMQYIGGAWVSVTAKTYQNGAWVDWLFYLYTAGNTYDGVTGGYTSYNRGSSGYAYLDADGMHMQAKYSSYHYPSHGFYTNQKIDFTKHHTVLATGNITKNDGYFRMCLSTGQPVNFGSVVADFYYQDSDGDFETALDITSVEGSYYFTAAAFVNGDSNRNATPKMTITKIWLE